MLLYSYLDAPWDRQERLKYNNSLRVTMMNLFLVPLLLLNGLYIWFRDDDFIMECPERVWWILPLEVLVKSYIGSLVFYVGHRMCHAHPTIYRLAHKHHHAYVDILSPVAAFDVTLTEFILVYFPAAFVSHQLSPLLFYNIVCTPFYSDLTSRVLEMLMSMHIHCNYIHPWDPLQYWPLYNRNHHAIHHRQQNYNFSAPHNILPDILFRSFRESKTTAGNKERENESIER